MRFRVVALAIAAAIPFMDAARAEAPRDLRLAFPFHDAELLSPGEAKGALAIVPGAIPPGERAAVVVLLHGVDLDDELHMWLGARGKPDIAELALRLVATGASRPFILVAPSQTRAAWSGRHMWQGFDLDDLLQSLETALGGRATVDRDAVIVLGHSGAGCNPEGGLLRVASAPTKVVPRAIVAVDTCLDDESGASLGSAPASARVVVRWQPEIWPRPIDRFHAAFLRAAETSGHAEPLIQRVDGLGVAAHDAIVADTFVHLVPSLLGGS